MSKRKRAERLIGRVVHVHDTAYRIMDVVITQPHMETASNEIISLEEKETLCLRMQRVHALDFAVQVLVSKVNSRVRYK